MNEQKLKESILTLLSKKNFSKDELELLLIRIRLLLEKSKKKKNYPTLNFYCDWNLHSEINRPDKIVDLILRLNEKILVEYDLEKKLNIYELINPEKLKSELNLFILRELNTIRYSIEGPNWSNLFYWLCEILENRPLKIPENTPKKYKEKIEKIKNYSTSGGHKIGLISFEIEFADGKSGHPKGTIMWKAKNSENIIVTGAL